jgi:AmmeMemoRadiSam system protein A
MTIAHADRNELLRLARGSIEAGLSAGRSAPAPAIVSPALNEPRATFVTLSVHDDLRGCCGSMESRFPLAEDVWRNAWASAFTDPRFPALTPAEYASTHLHISVLTPLERVPVTSEADLLAALRPGIDGLLLAMGPSRATFLPAVWESLPNPFDFLRHLKMKAGWPATFWSPQILVWRYETESFGEQEGCERSSREPVPHV